MSKIEIYEYRFVSSDFQGEPDKPWEHIGVLLAASHPHKTWTDDEIGPVVDEINATMERHAIVCEQHAESCTRAAHLLVAREGGKPCIEVTRHHMFSEPACQRRARLARECCRTPERPMLVRIHVDSMTLPATRRAHGA